MQQFTHALVLRQSRQGFVDFETQVTQQHLVEQLRKQANFECFLLKN